MRNERQAYLQLAEQAQARPSHGWTVGATFHTPGPRRQARKAAPIDRLAWLLGALTACIGAWLIASINGLC